MNLWDSQERTILRLSNALREGYQRPVVVKPTGGGKTRIAAHITKKIVDSGKRVVFLAPRRELIYQTVDQFEAAEIRTGMIMAGEPQNLYAPCQVASFDTLRVRLAKGRLIIPDADYVIVDEAHLSMAKGKLKVLANFSGAKIIGLTATPARGDGTGLGEFYDCLVNEVQVRELIDTGILVEPEYYAPTEWDLSGVKSNKDDYVVSQLEKAVDQPKLIGDIYENWERIASGLRTVIFCTTRKHARHVCEVFVSNGVACEYVDGDTPVEERAAIFNRVRSGETTVLCNVFVASYGLDIPPLECCVLARPTKNLTLYLQIVGRVLRASPDTGKTSATIIDHTGAVRLHGFVDEVQPWSLDGGDIRERKKKEKQAKTEPREIVCSNCFTVFKGQRECPQCGTAIVPKGEAVPTHQAELRKIDTSRKVYTDAEKIDWFGMLLSIQARRGYATGWARNQYTTKFGEPPAYQSVPMRDPTIEVLGFVKSRQIAYHAAKKKQRGLMKRRWAH